MIGAGAVAVLFWAYCGAMSVLAKSERPVLQAPLFQLSSVVLYFALAASVVTTFIHQGHPMMTVPAFVLVLILGVLLGYRYLGFLISENLDRFHASATGISTMKVQKTYDVAEKAEHDGEFDRAMALYGEEVARDPKDPEPLRRMGEIHLRRGAVTDALDCLRRALPLVADPEPKSTLAFRLSDLLEREGRTSEARSLLESIERDLAGTRYAAYARDRLAQQK
jgi:tetratricopeptide (TPR) repeat protein